MFGGDGEVLACCKEIRLSLGGGGQVQRFTLLGAVLFVWRTIKTILHIQRQKWGPCSLGPPSWSTPPARGPVFTGSYTSPGCQRGSLANSHSVNVNTTSAGAPSGRPRFQSSTLYAEHFYFDRTVLVTTGGSTFLTFPFLHPFFLPTVFHFHLYFANVFIFLWVINISLRCCSCTVRYILYLRIFRLVTLRLTD